MAESEPGRREILVGAAFIGVGVLARPTLAAAADGYEIVLKDGAGAEYRDDRFRFDPPTNTFWLEGVQVRFGSRDRNPIAPDFEFGIGNGKLTTRSILCHEIGDSVDIGGGRAGPDNAAPNAEPETTGARSRLVRFWGRSWVATSRTGSTEPVGWDGDEDGEDFAICGEMTIEADGDQTPTSRPGRVVLRSTRPNEHNPREGLVVTKRQQLCAANDGSPAAPAWTFVDKQTGFSRAQLRDGRVFVDVSISGKRIFDFRAPMGDQSSIALAYFGNDGDLRFEAIEVGGPDSGGPGYRILRVPN